MNTLALALYGLIELWLALMILKRLVADLRMRAIVRRRLRQSRTA